MTKVLVINNTTNRIKKSYCIDSWDVEIGEIKEIIEENDKKVPYHSQTLIYNGEVLSDDEALLSEVVVDANVQIITLDLTVSDVSKSTATATANIITKKKNAPTIDEKSLLAAKEWLQKNGSNEELVAMVDKIVSTTVVENNNITNSTPRVPTLTIPAQQNNNNNNNAAHNQQQQVIAPPAVWLNFPLIIKMAIACFIFTSRGTMPTNKIVIITSSFLTYYLFAIGALEYWAKLIWYKMRPQDFAIIPVPQANEINGNQNNNDNNNGPREPNPVNNNNGPRDDQQPVNEGPLSLIDQVRVVQESGVRISPAKGLLLDLWSLCFAFLISLWPEWSPTGEFPYM